MKMKKAYAAALAAAMVLTAGFSAQAAPVTGDGLEIDQGNKHVYVGENGMQLQNGGTNLYVNETGVSVENGLTADTLSTGTLSTGDVTINGQTIVNAGENTWASIYDGSASIYVDGTEVSIDSEGVHTGNLTAGKITGNGGAEIIGGLKADEAIVTGNATVDGTLTAGNGTLTVSDGSIIGLTNQSGLIVNDSMASLISNGNRLTVDGDGTAFVDVDGNKTVIKGDTVTTGTVTAETGTFTGDVHVGGDVYVDGRTEGVGASLNAHDALIKENASAIQQQGNAINSLNSRVSDLGDEIDNVGAISSALAGLHPLDYDGTGSKFQLAAAMGSYDGSQAAAIGGFYHFNEDIMMSVGGATAFDGDSDTAFNVGVSFRVGQGSSGKKVNSDDVLAQLEAMNEKIAALEAENQSLSEKVAALEGSEAAPAEAE